MLNPLILFSSIQRHGPLEIYHQGHLETKVYSRLCSQCQYFSFTFFSLIYACGLVHMCHWLCDKVR